MQYGIAYWGKLLKHWLDRRGQPFHYETVMIAGFRIGHHNRQLWVSVTILLPFSDG